MHDQVPHGRWAAINARLGDLAVWMGCYVAAAAVLLWRLVDLSFDGAALSFLITLTVSVYLMDRVKPIDALVDPADAIAHPARHRLMRNHAAAIRAVVAMLAAAAAVIGWSIHPGLTLLVPAAHVGVLIYAAAPKPVRPKDILIIKNLAVSLSLLALICIVTIAGPGTSAAEIRSRLAGFALATAALVLQVFADAMLCDLDDAAADRQFGTHTIPNTFGATACWWIAGVLSALGAVILITGGLGEVLQRRTAMIAGVGLFVTTLVLIARRPARVRDLAEIRLPLVVALAWVAGVLPGGF